MRERERENKGSERKWERKKGVRKRERENKGSERKRERE